MLLRRSYLRSYLGKREPAAENLDVEVKMYIHLYIIQSAYI